MVESCITDLVPQIKRNCNVSDAVYGGNLSLCNMLLRLRQLYYHENNLRPWQKVENKVIISWIGERESLWDSLDGKELDKIVINEQMYDPFDIEGINSTIAETGYIYGAGNGIFGKPQFFLGKLDSIEKKNQVFIYHLDYDICTDLMPSFALNQANHIYIRKDTLIDFLFYKFRDRKSGSFLDKAFAKFGLNQKTQKEKYYELFSLVAERVEKIFIYHELAEIHFKNNIWNEIVRLADDKKTELYLRAVKDGLADMNPEGTVARLLDLREDDLVLFYSAFMNDLYPVLFPDLYQALHGFPLHQDYSVIACAVQKSWIAVASLYAEILESYNTGGLNSVRSIINRIAV